MSDENNKKSRKENLFNKYLIYIFSFLAIALAFTVISLFVAKVPVTNLVHSLEDSYKMQVRDIDVDNSTYFLNGAKPDDEEVPSKVNFGDKIANVSIESCGLNCGVYYGANRVSMRNGAGLFSGFDNIDGGGLINDSMLLIKGYDETFFSSLKYVQIGDIVKLDSNYSDASYYSITEAKYIPDGIEPYDNDADSMLVLCSICSDFSEHSGEHYYVFAELINGEGN